MPFSEIYVKKYRGSLAGDLSYIVRGGNNEVIESLSQRNIVIATGCKVTNDEWLTGKSGIPCGKHILWTQRNKIQQYDDLDATGREVGRFYPISSSPKDHNIIYHPTFRWVVRKFCGLHDENDFYGSNGCVVTEENSEWRQLCNKLDILTNAKIPHIPFTVFWGEK